jgi:O-antigen ligase
MSLFDGTTRSGVLLKRRARPVFVEPQGIVFEVPVVGAEPKGGSHLLAFAGLFVFTLLLYARPNDLFPDLFGDFSTVKFVAIPTILVYVISKLVAGEPLTEWPIEVKMVGIILLLCVAFIPIAASPGDSIDRLSDPFLKVVAMFVLMANLINTKFRLRFLMAMMVIAATCIAIGAIVDFVERQFAVKVDGVGTRIAGNVGGIFGNPNDLATSLDLLIPIAVGLALTSGFVMRLFFLACAGVLSVGVVTTFSRGGFLGLVAVGSFLLWKISRKNRLIAAGAAAAALFVLLAAAPGGYGDRLFTILHTAGDKTGSAQERQEILKRAIVVAARHPIIGVGMNNFHIYSYKERVAHNSYLEISAELGLGGLIAYLILIFSPMRSLKRIEAQTSLSPEQSVGRELHLLSVAVQGAMIAYIVCSAFTSIEYLWYLYYPVAFAVALQKLCPVKLPVGRVRGGGLKLWAQRIIKGRLWDRYRPRRLGAAPVTRRGRLISQRSEIRDQRSGPSDF